jgi:hypothetical protein
LVDVEQNTRCGLLRGAHRLAAVLGPLITTAPALRRFFVAWAPPNKPLSLLRHITSRGWMQADSRRKAEWGCLPVQITRKTEPATAQCRVVALSVDVLIAAASAFFARVLLH